MTNDSSKYKILGTKIGELVDKKNKAYGNSFGEAGNFLKILYPDGIKPEQYTDMLCVVRIFDKLKRIATKKEAFDESPYRDIAGYSLLGLELDEKNNTNINNSKQTEQKINALYCSVCNKRIKSNETSVGTGDGTGQKFAHYDCYYTKQDSK